MKYYVVTYSGQFGFIKPWSAVRDASGGETYSQQFLTPSIVEGIRQKLEVKSILRHRLTYAGINVQQEMVQAKAWKKKGKQFIKEHSILNRGVMIYPHLCLAFESLEDAKKAQIQHICLCRNEDILLPEANLREMTIEEFDQLDGYELLFGKHENSFLVGYNRFEKNEEMYGSLIVAGNPIQREYYE